MTPLKWWLFAIIAVCVVFLYQCAVWIIGDILRDRKIRRRTSYPFTRGDRQ